MSATSFTADNQVVALCDVTSRSSSDSTVVATLQQSGAVRLWQLGTQQVSSYHIGIDYLPQSELCCAVL
jgi:hypothetical protein